MSEALCDTNRVTKCSVGMRFLIIVVGNFPKLDCHPRDERKKLSHFLNYIYIWAHVARLSIPE